MIGFGSALSFLGSRVGMIAIALVVGYFAGHSAASNGVKVIGLKSENASLRADMAVSEAAAKAADAEAESLRSAEASLLEKINEYRVELKARGDGKSCRLTGADVKRLRGIK